jgi:hypothetical protein
VITSGGSGLKVPRMRRFQTAASVLTHRLPVSENEFKILKPDFEL